MTLDKKEDVTLPQWALSLLVSVVGAVFAFIILWSGSKASLEQRASTNEKNIDILRSEKVDRNEFNIILNKLNSIEGKLDSHIQEK